MRGVFVAAALVVLLAGCSGSDGDDSTATTSASEVEASVKAQLAKGGGGVVDLGNDPPKLVTCTEGSVEPERLALHGQDRQGRSMLCIVQPRSGKKVPPRPLCGPIDN